MDIGHHCEFAHGWICARRIGEDTLFISFKGKGAIIEVDYCPKCGYSYQPERSKQEDEVEYLVGEFVGEIRRMSKGQL